MPTLRILPLTAEAFAPYGQVISLPTRPQDNEKGHLWRQVGLLEFQGGRPSVDVLYSPPRALLVDGMERHLNSTQAFVPMLPHPFVVVVAPPNAGDHGGVDHRQALAFVTDGRSGINLGVSVWHYPMIPLDSAQHFCIIHRAFDDALHGEFVKFRDSVSLDLEF